tara:strand:- start:336 stop:497 length:162 start_codon:yes stop_codon:yes gene_type:complete
MTRGILHVNYIGIIFALVVALGVVSFKYKDQSTKQANKCYQMFEILLKDSNGS